MKPVKIANGLAIADHDRAYITAFRFANRTADRAGKATGQFFRAAAQIEGMRVEFRGRNQAELQ